MDPGYILQLAQTAGLSVHVKSDHQPQAHISGSSEALAMFVNMIVSQDRESRPHAENLKCKSNQHRLATLWGYERTREPLTDDHILSIVRCAPALDTVEDEWLYVVRAVESAHVID